MSMNDLTAAIGVGAAYMAYLSMRKYAFTSSALRIISDVPSVAPSGLPSVLLPDTDTGKLVLVRGRVESLENNPASTASGVILEQKRASIYTGWRGIFGWTTDLRRKLSWYDPPPPIPPRPNFLLVEGDNKSPDCVVVNMEGSNHPLPTTTIHWQIEPIYFSVRTSVDEFFGFKSPVGVVFQDRILPRGKEVTALGIAYARNDGTKTIFEIQACKEFPLFLSNSTYTKDRIIEDLSLANQVILWSGIAFGGVAVVLIGFSAMKNWSKWKAYVQEQKKKMGRVSSRLNNLILRFYRK